MFEKILVPIDLRHLGELSRALDAAAQLAKSYSAEVIYVGVYGNTPTHAVPPAEEYSDSLKAFADKQAAAHGITTTSVAVFSNDPQAELTSILLTSAVEAEADAIVMASHIPGWIEHIFHSNAGYIASHATISVFVVR